MKPKQLFILFIIFLLATTLLFPKSKEERHCHQYSGESQTASPSEEFLACGNDSRCKVDADSVLEKDTEDDGFSFMCVPINHTKSIHLPE